MKKFLSERSSFYLILIGIVLIFFGIIIFLWNDFNFSIDKKISSEKFGAFGDFIGGIVGSLWALAGVILFYVALKEQRKDFTTNRKVLNAQSETLKQQIKEFELQRKELTETREIFKIQKFETSFFNLLKFHNDVVNSLVIEITRTKTSRKEKEKEVYGYSGTGFFIKANQLIENNLFFIGNLLN